MLEKIRLLAARIKYESYYNRMDIILILLSLGMGIYLKWNILETITFTIFIGIVLRPIPSRYPAMVALALVVLTPFFLVLKRETISDQVAIYAYYFLIMTVIMGIYEIRQEEKEKVDSEK